MKLQRLSSALIVAGISTAILSTSIPANAFAPAPIVAPVMPWTIATPIVPVAGTVATGTAAIGTATIAVPIAVAGVGLAIGYGAGMVLRKAVPMVWRWGTGHNPGYADQPFTPGDPPQGTNCGGTPDIGLCWTTMGNSTTPTTYFQLSAYQGVSGTGPFSATVRARTSAGTIYVANLSIARYTYTQFGCTSMGAPSDCTFVWVTARPGPTNPAAIGEAGWYSAGYSPAGSTAANPTGKTVITTTPTSQCSNGASVAGAAITYTGDTPDADLPRIIPPDCPEGTTRTGLTTPSTRPGGIAVPSPVTWTSPTIPAAFSECLSPKVCPMVLLKVSPDGQTINCTGNLNCVGWQALAQPIGQNVTVKLLTTGLDSVEPSYKLPDGSTMQCNWGPYLVRATECATVPTEPPTVPSPNAPDSENCMSGIFSWNPTDWVLVPIKCALKWAFIPPTGKMNEWSGRINNLKATPPISYISDGMDWLDTLFDSADNSGTTITGSILSPDGGSTFELLAPAQNLMQGGNNTSVTPTVWLWKIMIVACWIPAFMYTWTRISKAVGSKG